MRGYLTMADRRSVAVAYSAWLAIQWTQITMKSLIPKDKTGYVVNQTGEWEVWDCGKFCGAFRTMEEAKAKHKKVIRQKRDELLSANNK